MRTGVISGWRNLVYERATMPSSSAREMSTGSMNRDITSTARSWKGSVVQRETSSGLTTGMRSGTSSPRSAARPEKTASVKERPETPPRVEP